MEKTELFSNLTTNLKSYSLYDLPIIYQIELVGGICNLKCPLCPVSKGEVKRERNYFEIDMLKKMIKRGDFKNTFYIELQMYGEPTLHPEFDKIVRLLKKARLKVGLSINGTIWKEGLKEVDFITLSADSIAYRKGKDEEKFNEVVMRILKESKAKIDVQLIEIEDWQQQIVKLEELFKDYKERVLIRTIPDTFGQKEKKTNYEDFCINPLISVSIQSDGDVALCCFGWDKELVIGNLYQNTLKEIWQGEKRKEIIKKWIEGALPNKCKECKFRSPQMLHYRFLVNWQKRGWL